MYFQKMYKRRWSVWEVLFLIVFTTIIYFIAHVFGVFSSQANLFEFFAVLYAFTLIYQGLRVFRISHSIVAPLFFICGILLLSGVVFFSSRFWLPLSMPGMILALCCNIYLSWSGAQADN
ncbi:hypothetical protein [Lawsonibacter faecis]|uniref:Uncharacterized protein n=1 Tax=Lawsonibacter faecis TaxID=2763052 RepID=A0A8J6JAL5_9FIRM|nr:hypothetical protein [Lawsonibacter faecis]MBC5736678.1 hypothetical protein [Lawsonibacter faecis]